MARAFFVKVQQTTGVLFVLLLRTFRNENEGVLFLCHELQSLLLSPFLIRFLVFLLFFSVLFFSFLFISCPVRSRGILDEDNGNYASLNQSGAQASIAANLQVSIRTSNSRKVMLCCHIEQRAGRSCTDFSMSRKKRSYVVFGT